LSNLDSLRTSRLKVSFSLAELSELDQRRGHHSRAAWCRAAALGAQLAAAPTPAWATTWAESARLASCLTQLNEHASSLNSIRLAEGQAAAAASLAAELEQTRQLLAEFRAILQPS
jgi:hypothetical protein